MEVLQGEVIHQEELKDTGGVFLKIQVPAHKGWIYLDWVGYQDEKRTKEGMEMYLGIMRKFGLTKVLSDNRKQHGPYPKGIDTWIVQTWLPKAIQLGMSHGATILSPKIFARLSADNLLRQEAGPLTYLNFEDEKSAIEWLKNPK